MFTVSLHNCRSRKSSDPRKTAVPDRSAPGTGRLDYEALFRQLATQGLYLATTSNSSFFYVFTAMHALHLLGGIVALTYLVAQIASRRGSPRWSLFEGAGIYWHFMGILWVYLLVVIATRL